MRTKKCKSCISVLQNQNLQLTCNLLEAKDLGCLLRPSSDVVKIVNLENKILNSYNATSDILAQEMSLKSFKEVGLKLNSIFQTMHEDENIFIQHMHRIKQHSSKI